MNAHDTLTPAGPVPFAIAFAVVLVFVPVVRQVGLRSGLTDAPGPLKIHSQPTPRLGGVAILAGLLAAVLSVERGALHSVWLLLVALVGVWAAGFADDVFGASATFRLSVQLAAGALLWYAGWRIPFLGAGPLGFGGTCFLVMLFSNALNFLDGADGVAAGVAALITAGYVLLPARFLSGLGFVFAWSLLGACGAFLFYNFPKARIFMGDSGSTVLGFCIAFLSLDFCRVRPDMKSAIAFPLIAAGFPLLDAALAIARRLVRGVSPSHGDRSHFYDLLLERGWSPRRVAFTCYAVAMAFVATGWVQEFFRFAQGCWFGALVCIAFCVLAVSLGSLRSAEARTKA